MSTNRSDIFNAIITMLHTLSDFDGEDGTKRVYSFEVANPDGYPACALTSQGSESEILDTLRDKRTYLFNLRLYQEANQEDRGRSESERIHRELEDTVLSLFDDDNDLSSGGVSNIIRTTPISTAWGYILEGQVRTIDITLAVEAIIFVNP